MKSAYHSTKLLQHLGWVPAWTVHCAPHGCEFIPRQKTVGVSVQIFEGHAQLHQPAWLYQILTQQLDRCFLRVDSIGSWRRGGVVLPPPKFDVIIVLGAQSAHTTQFSFTWGNANKRANKKKLQSLGFEPRLPRPQRGVLTTIRWRPNQSPTDEQESYAQPCREWDI